jgi:hypothetical protein
MSPWTRDITAELTMEIRRHGGDVPPAAEAELRRAREYRRRLIADAVLAAAVLAAALIVVLG